MLLDSERPLTPDCNEDDIVRLMLTADAGKVRGAWWCDKCTSLLSSPDIGIGHLFALLRQWTPCTQLQLDTIVMEVRNCTLNSDNKHEIRKLTMCMSIDEINSFLFQILKRGAHVDDRDGMTDMTLLHYTAKSGALGNEDLALKRVFYLLKWRIGFK